MADPIITPYFAAYLGSKFVLPMVERAVVRLGENLGDSIVHSLRCDPGEHLRSRAEQIVLNPGANLIQFNGPVNVYLHGNSLSPNTTLHYGD
jgi:hypothetical protein